MMQIYTQMKTIDHTFQNLMPNIIEERDVFGQIKPNGIRLLKRYKYRLHNAPDLEVNYASFGIRFLAKFIDLMILLIPFLVFEQLFFKFDFTNFDYNSYRFFLFILIVLIYSVAFESSVYQATIGKMIVKVKVIGLFGKRLSVLQAFYRCITTIISILPMGLGIWYMTTDSKKRTWHDLIAGTYVIKT
jgi:uncharacterized RDD family membrane protein YckC